MVFNMLLKSMVSNYSKNVNRFSVLPNHEEHCAESLKRYGKTFSEVHTWMDEPSLLLGSSHRKYRHDPDVTPFEAKAIFSEGADNVCLDHIRLDELESRKSITTIWFPNTNYYEVKSVLPVIQFTIQSRSGVSHFESEAVNISKDGQSRFTYVLVKRW
jgi:hypothetical protein